MSNVIKVFTGRCVPITIAAATLLVALTALIRADDDNPPPIDPTHNALDAPIAGGVFGSPPALRAGERICTTPPQAGPDVDTTCEGPGPSNETAIAVNPTNADNIIGGANDYQEGVDPGGHLSASIISRAHVTFDGGKTWSEYPIFSDAAYQGTGDPAIAFDADGHAYYATLGWRWVGQGNSLTSDVVVANSADGGKTWSSIRVAAGTGNAISARDVLDKEYVAAWGHGNVVVTYGDFHIDGSSVTATIFSSISHDAGKTWSIPTALSGSIAIASGAVPIIAADGRLYVAFQSSTDFITFHTDEYDVVEVSPQTGARIAGPIKVASMVAGATDFPTAFGRETYQDSIFRSWGGGNITADATNAAHLAVIWSDMRNSTTPLPQDLDPYASITNSDIVVSQSFDNGRTWSAPAALELGGDQFMPWGAYDAHGVLRIGFYDRQYDPANHRYGYTLASETAPGTLTFTTTPLTTTLSDPTTGMRWFARTVNQLFPFATRFIGDYANIAAVPGGGVVAYWTDLRNQVCFAGRCGHTEDAFFRRAQ